MHSHRNLCVLAALPQILHQLTDPRDPRSVRHPFVALCSLVFLGLLARIVEMAVLVRWAHAHWDTLRAPPRIVRVVTHFIIPCIITDLFNAPCFTKKRRF
jgi:hypothetical protein